MGTVFPRQSDNMKLFAVLALAAVAFAEPEAEAGPALLYGAYGYGLPYTGVYGGYRTYGAYPYSYGYYGKRSADAEPEADAEADPALLYRAEHLLYGAYGYGLPNTIADRIYGAVPHITYKNKNPVAAEKFLPTPLSPSTYPIINTVASYLPYNVLNVDY